MSRFLSGRHSRLVPYTPGEQPRGRKYIKLNTNESPFPPSPKAIEYAHRAAAELELYPDPESCALRAAAAAEFGVKSENIIAANGSDEILSFAFTAFCDSETAAAFPDITYGFYPVFAKLNGVPYTEIPLAEDFRINAEDYLSIGKTIFIANPNAPTGLTLSTAEIEKIAASNPENVVVIDEAYVDFGAESCIPLTQKYDNLLVVQTFSKSRSMAGARLGFGIGCAELICDLNTIRNSTNPYNVNRMTAAAGLGALEDSGYMRSNCKEIEKVREYTKSELLRLGFGMTDSSANFVFVTHPKISGGELYRRLRECGILVRHFEKERISEYNRITIGTYEQMQTLIEKTEEILKGV